MLRDHVPLLKLVEQLQLGHSLQLLSAQFVFVNVIEVFGARKLPPRREIPAAQSQQECESTAQQGGCVCSSAVQQHAPCCLSSKVWVRLKRVEGAAACDQIAHHDLKSLGSMDAAVVVVAAAVVLNCNGPLSR
jgi:hypothetical protein